MASSPSSCFTNLPTRLPISLSVSLPLLFQSSLFSSNLHTQSKEWKSKRPIRTQPGLGSRSTQGKTHTIEMALVFPLIENAICYVVGVPPPPPYLVVVRAMHTALVLTTQNSNCLGRWDAI
ncbi:hypothetical protein C1H46_027782 [Malus baccata]|uniref:Uncharacterized protein n=1 Tax=Malus baccata TaxID=106549 RepID=A0A540LJK5_MALBA|nr:hypothetical protein C1H46_027782 [Malus baccata]